MTDPSDLSGFWTGRYLYGGGIPSVTFLATLRDENGALTGEISEPNRMGSSSSELHAFLRGTHDGGTVSFIKTYDGASDAAHSVRYDGRLSADGCFIGGQWNLVGGSGAFEMRREIIDAEEEDMLLAETVGANG